MKKTTGEIVAAILEKSGMSQRTLAKKAGVSQGSISLWVNGENVPKLDIVERILSIINPDSISGSREEFLIRLEDERLQRKVDSAKQSHAIQTSGLTSEKVPQEGYAQVRSVQVIRESQQPATDEDDADLLSRLEALEEKVLVGDSGGGEDLDTLKQALEEVKAEVEELKKAAKKEEKKD